MGHTATMPGRLSQLLRALSRDVVTGQVTEEEAILAFVEQLVEPGVQCTETIQRALINDPHMRARFAKLLSQNACAEEEAV